jgi:hypothetical protein
MQTLTVAQMIRGLKKYRGHLRVMQGGVGIKAMRITAIEDSPTCVVRLIRQDEKR